MKRGFILPSETSDPLGNTNIDHGDMDPATSVTRQTPETEKDLAATIIVHSVRCDEVHEQLFMPTDTSSSYNDDPYTRTPNIKGRDVAGYRFLPYDETAVNQSRFLPQSGTIL